MSTTFTKWLTKPSTKSAKRPLAGLPVRRLRLESLETRDLLAAFAGFALTGYPATTTAGNSNSFLLTAVDTAGAKVNDYAGTVHFSSGDGQAALPTDYSFTAADFGDRSFSATFKTEGNQVLTATDTGSGITSQFIVGVNPAGLKKFLVTGLPSPYIAGSTQTMLVTAQDTYGNTVPAYLGTVSFSSNDPSAKLPANYKFTVADAGSHSFDVTLNTSGTSRSVTVTDLATGSTGKQTVGPVTVQSSDIRYASTSNTIYLSSGRSFTLSTIKALLPNAPLTLVDSANAIWKLDANIVLQNGSTLVLHGTSLGGDVNQLRMKSDNVSGGNAIVFISADYGNIDIDSTKVTSWDSAINGPDTEYATYKRAYIRARSALASDGVTPRESRMDVLNSNIGYLGYYGAEAYGLSWKVVGSPGTNFNLYDKVGVFGNIENNHIHHNFFGVYTFGFQGGYGDYSSLGIDSGRWADNEVDHNVVYGIDPHDDSDGMLIFSNNVHDNGTDPNDSHSGSTYNPDGASSGIGDELIGHGIILSQRCDGVIIAANLSWNNEGHGIMLHRASDNNQVTGNTLESNTRDGIVVFDSYHNEITYNVARNNENDGLRLSVGSAYNIAMFNQLYGNQKRGVDMFPGSDTPLTGGNGYPHDNTIQDNAIYNNGERGIRVQQGDRNLFVHNSIYGNLNPELLFAQAVDNVFRDNTFLAPNGVSDANVFLSMTGKSTSKSNTFVSGQPSLQVSLDQYSTATFTDVAGRVFQIGSSTYPPTTIFPTGSKLVFTSAMLGNKALITTIDLAVSLSSSSSTVQPVIWNAVTKQFNVSVASTPLNLGFRIGGLTSGTSYKVSRNGAVFTTITADVNGFITFNDQLNTTAVFSYAITAA